MNRPYFGEKLLKQSGDRPFRSRTVKINFSLLVVMDEQQHVFAKNSLLVKLAMAGEVLYVEPSSQESPAEG